MLDKHVDKKINYFQIKNNNKEINIKLLSDIHYCESFNLKKLDIIEKELDKTKTDYVFIAGDIINSTNFLETNNERKEILLKWFKKLSKKYKIFICLGNHDYYYFEKHVGRICNDVDFWNELFNIPNIYNNEYEDEYIKVNCLTLPFEYYINDNEYEDKNILLQELDKIKNKESNKINILMVHSPIYFSDKEVLEKINNYDFVFSGHTHNGMVPMFIDRIKSNRGLISPHKKMFMKNIRGNKKVDKTNIIISGGITKISENVNILLRWGNFLYPMNINEIIIK